MNQARQYKHLDYQERQTIAISREQVGIRAIARILNRSPSTISREIERNRGGASQLPLCPTALHSPTPPWPTTTC